MKITELHIEGFRSLKNVTWKPGALNVVIGPNGSGKSNLLRLLEMISASANGKLDDYFLKSGGIDAVMWDGAHLDIIFQLKASQHNQYYLNDKTLKNYTYEVKLKTTASFSYSFLSEKLAEPDVDKMFMLREGAKAWYIDYLADPFAEPESDIEHRLNIDEKYLKEESLLSIITGSPINLGEISILHQWLIYWRVFSDIRVDQYASIRLPSITRFERQISADGQNLITVLHTLYTEDREFKRSINTAMRAAFGEDFEELIFPPASDQRIQMRVRWKTLKREQSTADLSDGTLRFLFLITVLANPNPPPLIAIDEPETGLHPSMLPIIAEYAEEASERTQIIFTTHSAQFLSAFRQVRPTTTIAQWEEGETKLTVLDNEQLDHWLKEYTLGEMMLSGTLESLA